MEDLDDIRAVLNKPSEARSHDDILLVKHAFNRNDFLRRLLYDASAYQLDEICRYIILEEHEEDDTIISQGDFADRMFVILKGSYQVKVKYKVELYNGESENREKLLMTCTEWQHFGENALESNEPNAATVVATSRSTSMVLQKSMFQTAMQYFDDGVKLSKMHKDSKEYVFRVLSLARRHRTLNDLEAVSKFLDRRILFFQKFSSEQRLELSRVAEVLSIWGKRILFKQGSLGQAFYIILSGSVEVFVNSAEKAREADKNKKPGYDNSRPSIYDGLGDRVTVMAAGDVFGERALENESSKRMASVVTCDDLTELIVLAKEDYHNLVAVMMQSGSMERIQVLRKTALFRSVDVSHLKHVAKYMILRQHHIDEILYSHGDEGTDIIITELGECRAIVECEASAVNAGTVTGATATTATDHSNSLNTDTKSRGVVRSSSMAVINKYKGKQILNLGRIAPYSVMGVHVALCTSMQDLSYYKETLVTTTLVRAYYINKHDLFYHLPKETLGLIVHVIRSFPRPMMIDLWESMPQSISENEWKIENAWKNFKNDIAVKKKKSSDLLESFRIFNEMQLEIDLNRRNSSTTIASSSFGSLSPTRNNSNSVTIDWGTPASIEQDRLNRRQEHVSPYLQSLRQAKMRQGSHKNEVIGSNDYKGVNYITRTIQMGNSRESSKQMRNHIQTLRSSQAVLPPMKHTMVGSAVEDPAFAAAAAASMESPVSDKFVQLPFALVQIHRRALEGGSGGDGNSKENNNHTRGKSSGGKKRYADCFLRLCGLMASCGDAKYAAEKQIEHVFIVLFNGNLAKAEELKLKWQIFSGFDSIPMQCSDHFIIYCRGSPMQYCSFSPSEDLLTLDFPAACKVGKQRYSVVMTKPLSAPSLDAEASGSELSRAAKLMQSSAFIKEVAVIDEVLMATLSKLDCFRYAVLDTMPFLQQRMLSSRNFAASGLKDQSPLVDGKTEDCLCVMPLYEWILVTKESMKSFQCNRTLQAHANETIDDDVRTTGNNLNSPSLVDSLSSTNNSSTTENDSTKSRKKVEIYSSHEENDRIEEFKFEAKHLRRNLKETGLLPNIKDSILSAEYEDANNRNSNAIEKKSDNIRVKPIAQINTSKSVDFLLREIETKRISRSLSSTIISPMEQSLRYSMPAFDGTNGTASSSRPQTVASNLADGKTNAETSDTEPLLLRIKSLNLESQERKKVMALSENINAIERVLSKTMSSKDPIYLSPENSPRNSKSHREKVSSKYSNPSFRVKIPHRLNDGGNDTATNDDSVVDASDGNESLSSAISIGGLGEQMTEIERNIRNGMGLINNRIKVYDKLAALATSKQKSLVNMGSGVDGVDDDVSKYVKATESRNRLRNASQLNGAKSFVVDEPIKRAFSLEDKLNVLQDRLFSSQH